MMIGNLVFIGILVLQVSYYNCLASIADNCEYGCKDCQQQNKQNICVKCYDGYILDTSKGFCKYDQCDRNLVFSLSNQEQQCVAICEDSQVADLDIQQCINLEECNKSYISKSSTSQRIQIRDIFIYSEEFLLILYDSYFNVVDRNTGVIEQSIPYQSGIIKFQLYQNIPFLMLSNQSIIKWDFVMNSIEVISNISNGVFSQESEIISIDNQIICVTSFSLDKKLLFITPIFLVQFETLQKITFDIHSFKIEIQSLNSQFLNNKFLIELKDKSIKIQILKVVKSNELYQLQFQPLLFNFIKCDIMNYVLEFKIVIDLDEYDQNLIVIIKQIPFFIIISIKNQNCRTIQLNNNPIKFHIIQKANSSSYYFQIQFQNSFQIYDQNFNSLSKISFQSSINQIQCLSLQNSLYKLYFLLDNSQINMYTFDSVSLDFKYIGDRQIQIEDPKFLKVDNYSKFNKNQAFNTLFVFNYDCQAFNQLTDETIYIQSNFKMNYISHKQSITSIATNQSQQFLVSASKDGNILIWQIQNKFEGYQIFSFNNIAEQCFSVLIFKEKFIIGRYQTQFVIINIYNPYQQNIITLNQGQKTIGMLTLGDNFMLVQGDCAAFYDQKLQRQFIFCEETISLTQNLQLIKDSKIIITTDTQIFICQINYIDQSLKKLYSYLSSESITKFIMRIFSNDSYEFVIIDSKNNIIQLNSQLIKKYEQKLDTIKTPIDINYPANSDEEIYCLIAIHKDTSILNKYYIYKINFKQNPIFEYWNNIQIGSEISKFYISQDILGNYFYNIIVMMPQPSQQIFGNVRINKSTNEIHSGPGIYSPLKKLSAQISPNYEGVLHQYSGYESGQVVYSANHKRVYRTVFQSTTGFINKIYQSQRLQTYYIITQQVHIFNINTDQLIEIITFEKVDEVINLITSDQLRISIFFQINEISLKNYMSNKTFKKKDFGQCRGIYIDDLRSKIYIYGSKFSSFSINLDSEQLIINLNIIQCVFSADIAFCKIDNQEVHAYSLVGYSLQFKIKPQDLPQDYKIDIDLNYQYLYFYYQVVQIYRFNGDFVTYLTQPSKPLIQIKPYGTKVVVHTSGNLYIYSRDKLDYLTMQMSPSEGNIIWIKYLEQEDQLVFASDLFGNGQIFLYSLSKLSDPVGISNAIYQQKEQAVGYFYHPHMQYGVFVDRLGQVQAINYKAAYGNGNILSLKQFFKADYLTHFLFNLDTNKILIGNSQNVFAVILNALFKQPQQYFQQKVQKYVSFKYNNQNILLLVDKQNYLYKYSNYKLRFVTFFKRPVLDIQFIDSSSLIIIALQDTIYSYDLTSFINLTQNTISPLIEIKGFLYKEYLGKQIFQTFDQKIIDYNFKQNQIKSQFQLDKEDDFITKKYWIQQDSILLLGMNQGYIIVYNTNNFQFYKIIQKNLIMPIKCFIEISSSLILVFFKNGSVIQIDDFGNKNYLKMTQLSYLLPNDTILESELEFCDAVYDSKYQRIYSWLVHLQRLHVLDPNNFEIIIYISFPSNEINKLSIGEMSLLLYSQFQIHIYLRSTLEFLFSIRKASRYDKITNLTLLQDKFLVLCLLQKVEIYLIDLNSKSFQLIDTIITDYPAISFSEIINISRVNSSQNFHIIGISLTNIFQKTYNLNLFNQIQNQCSSQLDASSIFRLKSEYEINYQSNTNITQTFFLKINSTLETAKILDQKQQKLVIVPLSGDNKQLEILNLKINSFLYIKNDLVLKNFQLKFVESGVYQTNDGSENIVFQNILIDAENIQEVNIDFQNKKQIIFKKLTIKGDIKKRSLNDQDYIKETFKSSFFLIQNTETVSIYDLIIENADITSKNVIFIFKNIKYLTIKGLNIRNSSFKMIFKFYQIQKLELLDFLISENYNQQIQVKENNEMYFIFKLEGAQETIVKNLTLQDNKDILLLQSASTYVNENKIITLTDDNFTAQNIFIKNNLFSNFQNITHLFNNSLSQIQSLIYLQNGYIKIINSTIQNNQSNLKIYDTAIVIIKNCTFTNNTSQKGGGLFLKQIQEELQIQNSTFSLNKAQEDGGGIYMSNISNIIISENSRIINNQAHIGGGIRFTNIQYQSIQISEDSLVMNNFAEIYGNNIANYPTSIKVNIDYDSKNITFFQNKSKIQEDKYQQIQDIKNYQSGGQMNITVQFVDDDYNILQLSEEKILNNKYPKSIIEDIKKLSFSISSTENIYLSDEGTVNYKYYDKILQGFFKKDLVVSAIPNQNKTLLFNYQMSGEESLKTIQLDIFFRECQVGEIEKIISPTNIICQSCPFGFYSLHQFNKKDQRYLFQENIQCIKCPNSAKQCEKNIVQVKNGYWRKNNETDEILFCENNKEVCVPENQQNQFGCLEGHIGPLCELCDLSGLVWKGKKYTQSINKLSCSECSQEKWQITYILIFMMILLTYLFWIFLMFITSQYKAQTCYYLRKLSIIPFSVTQYYDKSNFYLKILVNHLQIAYLLKLQIQFIPELIKLVPGFLGSAVSQIAINTLCLFSNEQINRYGQGKIKQIIQLLIPGLMTIILLITLLLFKYLKLKNIKNHSIYTLTDSLNLYAQSLRCRQIGSNSFISQDLLFSCEDESYSFFIKYFTIPILVFWVVYPIFPLIFLYRNKNKLNTCLIKFKFGYYYSEFSEQFYYWEFIRIYLKVFIVFICTFLSELSIVNSLFLNLIIFLYIILVIKNKPFFSKKLIQLEIQSYITITILVTIKTLIQYYKHITLEISNFICLYIFIIYLTIVILIEITNKSQNKFGQILRVMLIALLGQKRFQSQFNYSLQGSTLRVSLRWKKIYQNIHLLTQIKALNILNYAGQQKILKKLQNSSPIIYKIDYQNIPFKIIGSDSIDKLRPKNQSSQKIQSRRQEFDETSSKFRETQNTIFFKEQRKNLQENSLIDNKSITLIKEISYRSNQIYENIIQKNKQDNKEQNFVYLKKDQQQLSDNYEDIILENTFLQNNAQQNLSINSLPTENDISDPKQYQDVFTRIEGIKSNTFQAFNQLGQKNINKPQ